MPDSIIDRRTNTYQLDPDAHRGFTTAVRNGQVRLALEYLVPYLHTQNQRIVQLEGELAVMQTEQQAEAPRRGRRPRAEVEAETTVVTSSSPPAPPENSVKEAEVKESPEKERVAS